MKRIVSAAAFALVVGLASVTSAMAQNTCAPDDTLNAAGSVMGNTCGKNLFLTTICGGGDGTNGQGTSVVQLNIGNSANFGLQVVSSTSGFNPELAFTSGACSSLSGCTVDDTNNTQTVPATGMGTGYSDMDYDGPNPQPSAGTGFVFITDLNFESPGCGDYTLNLVGTLPVTLKDFSVN